MSPRIIAETTVDLDKGQVNIPVSTPIDTEQALFYTLAILRQGFKIEFQDTDDRTFRAELRHGDVRLRRDMANKVRYLDTTRDFPEFFCRNDWDIYVLDRK